MGIQFTKYHGTGNDFIIIDDRRQIFDHKDTRLINQLCSRRFGIGADGLILLRNVESYDFEMVYFNSDGKQSSMCGNGGRCIVHFAHSLGLFEDKCNFLAIDGHHEAEILEDDTIKLKMGNVSEIIRDAEAFVLNTGSPHYVVEVEHVDAINVKIKGASIRYSENYKHEGINVNFLEQRNKGIEVATYERGVEDETFSCGTGVTASAIAAHRIDPEKYRSPINVRTKGGDLKVFFRTAESEKFTDIWLKGPAVKTFDGQWNHSD